MVFGASVEVTDAVEVPFFGASAVDELRWCINY